MKPILEQDFYHDGRGPELVRTVWGSTGAKLIGFEYYNPDAVYDESQLCHLLLEKVEAYSMASEEVHSNISHSRDSRASAFDLGNSDWKRSLDPRHLDECSHFQVVFYDEIFDIICKSIRSGKGTIYVPTV